MTVMLDERGGAKKKDAPDYYPGLLHSLIPDSELTLLDSGDACWMGNGGELIGVELKKIPDAVSCMFSGRLADEQISKMKLHYDIRYLIIEGYYRPDPRSGVMQRWLEFDSKKDVKCGRWSDVIRWDRRGKEGLMFSSFVSWLSSLEILGGVRVKNTGSVQDTAAVLLSLHNWWQRSTHRTFNVMYTFEGNGANLSRPTRLKRMLNQLPHVAWDRSGELVQRVAKVQFINRKGKVMHGKDWYIEGQIAAKSAADIDRVCEGKDAK